MISNISQATSYPSSSLNNTANAPSTPKRSAVPSLTDSTLRVWLAQELVESKGLLDASTIDASLGAYPHLARRAKELMNPLAMIQALTPQSICKNPMAVQSIIKQVDKLPAEAFSSSKNSRLDLLINMASKLNDVKIMIREHPQTFNLDPTKKTALAGIELKLDTWHSDLRMDALDDLNEGSARWGSGSDGPSSYHQELHARAKKELDILRNINLAATPSPWPRASKGLWN